MKALKVSGLRKKYKNFEALRGVDLEISEGEIFALLGPNGAGKTTFIRILAEGLKYDAGRISVFGEPLTKKSARLVGYVPQESIAYDLLTVEENLRFYADIYDVPRDRIEELIELFELPKKKRAKELSGGYRHRLNFAIALLYEPKLLILDEPTVGLDVPSRRDVWQLIEHFRDNGKTVLIATHYMEEAEMLADRVGVINEGRIIALGTPAELKGLVGKESIIHVEGILKGAEKLKESFKVIEKNGEVRIHVRSAREALPLIVQNLVREGSEIKAITVEEPTLEDVFMRLTGRGLE